MKRSEKNIIIFNLKTDADDDVLGFTTDWINAFAKCFNKVFVITMSKGKDETADNVEVYSVGKEKGYSEPRRVIEFYKIFNKLIKEHKIEGIFAHMIPEFAILAGPLAKKNKIPLVLWFAHKSVNWRLKLAEKFVTRIFTPSPESCRLKNRGKIVITGHGINTEKFRPLKRKNSKTKTFLTVSRISPIKNIDKMIEFIGRYYLQNNNISFSIVGRPLNSLDKKYYESLKRLVENKKLGKIIKFKQAVPYKNIEKEYQRAAYFLNFSETGSVDKAVLEALCCGCLPITTNSAFKGQSFYFETPEKIDIDKIKIDKKIIEKNKIVNVIQKFVEIIKNGR